MSVMQPETPRFEDHITITGVTPRNVNTQFGPKTVWDVIDERGRKLQAWKPELGGLAMQLVGTQNLRVEYLEKPSRDPNYPPNLELQVIDPPPGTQMQPQQPVQAQPAPQPVQQQVMQQPAASGTQAAVQQAPTPGAGTGGSPSAEDKVHMRRSAAVKAAAYAIGSFSGEQADFWVLTHQIMRYIETGEDPVPF